MPFGCSFAKGGCAGGFDPGAARRAGTINASRAMHCTDGQPPWYGCWQWSPAASSCRIGGSKTREARHARRSLASAHPSHGRPGSGAANSGGSIRSRPAGRDRRDRTPDRGSHRTFRANFPTSHSRAAATRGLPSFAAVASDLHFQARRHLAGARKRFGFASNITSMKPMIGIRVF